jgi:high-affinity nickel-transport protein
LFWASLSRGERRTVAAMVAAVAGLHVLGFVGLFAFVAPGRHHLGNAGIPTIGLGVTAYTLGLRHAFDADHISAIDNTTRTMMAKGKRPLSVGTAVSGGFLYLIAAINIVILLGIVKVFREMRTGRYDEAGLERQLDSRGLMNRLFGRLTKAVAKPRHMYPVGLLFGLGFDTASEVALLVIAGGAGAAGAPWYGILCLPILFAAGMSLMDSIDGSFMNFAYGWALSKPVRKVFYNLTITALSAAVALVIGTIEVGGLISSELGLSGSFWSWFETVDINVLGFVIVALFVVTWAIALVIWRLGRIEERWSAHLENSGALD